MFSQFYYIVVFVVSIIAAALTVCANSTLNIIFQKDFNWIRFVSSTHTKVRLLFFHVHQTFLCFFNVPMFFRSLFLRISSFGCCFLHIDVASLFNFKRVSTENPIYQCENYFSSEIRGDTNRFPSWRKRKLAMKFHKKKSWVNLISGGCISRPKHQLNIHLGVYLRLMRNVHLIATPFHLRLPSSSE